jgi:hypothetical protein
MAFKYVLHFVGDLHQPLHAADHDDRGGNCIQLDPPVGPSQNLHAYWDTAVVGALGPSASAIATKLNARITPDEIRAWSAGDPKSWAMQSFQVAQKDVYRLPAQPTCQDKGSVALSPAYQAAAQTDAARQLQLAGIRIAVVLNSALGAR